MTHASTHFLARYQTGALSERRSAAVARHLSTCARCSRLSAELSAIPAALASVPAPPMPGSAQARISDALAAEATRRAEAGPAADGAERGRSRAAAGEDARQRPGSARQRPGSARQRPGSAGLRPGQARGQIWPLRMPRLAPLSGPVALRVASAAAAIAILAGGGYGWHLLTVQHPAAGAAASRHALAPRPAPHLRAAAPAGGPGTVYYQRGERLAAAPVFATGTNFRPGTLAADVRGSLAQADSGKTNFGSLHSSAASDTRPTPGAIGSAGGIGTASLPGCVSRIAAGHRVIAVDIGRYQGLPAAVIALALPRPRLADVWVVGAGCSAARSDVLAHAQVRI